MKCYSGALSALFECDVVSSVFSVEIFICNVFKTPSNFKSGPHNLMPIEKEKQTPHHHHKLSSLLKLFIEIILLFSAI